MSNKMIFMYFGPPGSCNVEINFFCQPEGQKPGS